MSEVLNILVVCLDDCRYDSFVNAGPKNMLSIGELQKVYSYSCWTTPSIIGYLQGIPPIGVSKKVHGYLYPDYERFEWAPRYYIEKGYTTAYFSVNPVPIIFNKTLDNAFSKYFTYYKTKYSLVGATPYIVRDFTKIVKKEDKPMFTFMLLMDTHPPFFFGKYPALYNDGNAIRNRKLQRQAVQYDDILFTKILEAIKESEYNTYTIITSDHGELFGSEINNKIFGHDPSDNRVYFHKKLFEIPYIQGIVRGR